jgi:hypothetical protein
MNKTIPIFIALILIPIFGYLFYQSQLAISNPNNNEVVDDEDDMVFCTMEAKICADGSGVGRSGPKCEFQKCPYEDQIIVEAPTATFPIESPLQVKGQAIGSWFFEGSFPVTLKDDKGNILATGLAETNDDWMTENFVDFELELKFTAPKSIDGMGSLIFKKSNPSGLPEKEDELVMPIGFVIY